MDAVFMSFRLEAGQPADAVGRHAGTAGTPSVTLAPPVPQPNDMDAAPMSLELHERGIHAV